MGIRRAVGVAVVACALAATPAAADPLYLPPQDLAAHANGEILQSREIAASALLVPLPVRSWQVQYKSSDSDDNATTGVATILVPNTPWPGPGPRPLVAFQAAIDSVGTRCDPSYAIRDGIQTTGFTNSQAEMPFALAGLLRGWALVIADFQGPQARFFDGPQNAHSVLDAIRATLRFAPAGLPTSTPIGAYGVSGGAFATAWAAKLQPSYAPEIPLAAALLGDLPARPASLNGINRGPEAGLLVLALVAAVRNNPESRLEELLNERGRAVLAENQTACASELLPKYLNADINEFSAVPDLFAEPRVQAVLAAQNLGTCAPAAPLYVYHSVADELIPIDSVDATVAEYRAHGTDVTYVRSQIPTHTGAGWGELPGGLTFLADRLTREAYR
ncbi:lipase family protein [Antrihabitans stalactiti]|uniref:Lipase n=1 Tax=Antrihabitans stalactiti TaxID=2584121 RepID=A0A848KSL4_9NOCA|nr:lipase family protein [Antrihabitans stalactiti]NMN98547.1 lipase [Antrihabitans stalactiti]